MHEVVERRPTDAEHVGGLHDIAVHATEHLDHCGALGLVAHLTQVERGEIVALGKVETNVVTDPSSVALTLNSTRSVAVDLRDPLFMPSAWSSSPSPKLARTSL